MFIHIAFQKVKKDKLRTDLVTFDHTTETPISVKIESFAQINSHHPHVNLNMIKWKDLGFKECHV